MKQQTHTSANSGHARTHILALGKARKLTRASFTGNRPEMIDERVYTLGG
jgi:hypothetical protein